MGRFLVTGKWIDKATGPEAESGQHWSHAMRDCPACGSSQVVLVDPIEGWETQQCGRCGMRTVTTPPDAQSLQNIYNSIYKPGNIYQKHLNELEQMRKYGSTWQGLYRNWVFLRRYKPNPGDRLLEIGCGVGAFMVEARRLGWDVQGIDLSEEALEISSSVHGIPVHHGTIEGFEAPDSSFSAVVCWEVLEHLVSPTSFLTAARRLLKPGGLFVCSVPNEGPLVPKYVPGLGPASAPPVHLNFWDPESFRNFFTFNGFEPLICSPKRSIVNTVGATSHPVRWVWDQMLAIAGKRQGTNIFAVARRR